MESTCDPYRNSQTTSYSSHPSGRTLRILERPSICHHSETVSAFVQNDFPAHGLVVYHPARGECRACVLAFAALFLEVHLVKELCAQHHMQEDRISQDPAFEPESIFWDVFEPEQFGDEAVEPLALPDAF